MHFCLPLLQQISVKLIRFEKFFGVTKYLYGFKKTKRSFAKERSEFWDVFLYSYTLCAIIIENCVDQKQPEKLKKKRTRRRIHLCLACKILKSLFVAGKKKSFPFLYLGSLSLLLSPEKGKLCHLISSDHF